MYPIQLTDSERNELNVIVKTGRHKARVMRRAQILLWSDAGKRDTEIAPLLQTTPLTVAKTRQRWVESHDLNDAPRPGRKKKLDAKQEAFLVALACSAAPTSQTRWTMQLLADKVVELGIVENPISDETVRRTFKKLTLSLGSKSSGVFHKSVQTLYGGWRMF
jgi:transposase